MKFTLSQFCVREFGFLFLFCIQLDTCVHSHSCCTSLTPCGITLNVQGKYFYTLKKSREIKYLFFSVFVKNAHKWKQVRRQYTNNKTMSDSTTTTPPNPKYTKLNPSFVIGMKLIVAKR